MDIQEMELKDFVSGTLKQIIEGVKDAQINSQKEGAEVNPDIAVGTEIVKHGLMETESGKLAGFVDFDIALTVVEGKEKKGGIGVAGGFVGLGGQRQSSAESSSNSRIKFKVPLALPLAK